MNSQNLSRLQRTNGRFCIWVGALDILLWLWLAFLLCYLSSMFFAPNERFVAQTQDGFVVFRYISGFWPNLTNVTLPAGLGAGLAAVRAALFWEGILEVLLAAGLALSVAGLWRMFDSMQLDHSPFTLQNVKRIRRAACFTLCALPLRWFWSCCVESALIGAAKFSIRVSSGLYLYLLLFVVGLALYSISFAFEYGVRLQQESDETL